ncbi:MAG TPA: PA0069 family radical SAM protein [Gemmataceae bacterium]|nr:PA0069 family radical SAM protein [Gemmataceae bacterium]
MEEEQQPIRGRGASSNPANRFELIHYERDDTIGEEEAPAPATRFYRDHARSILVRNDSPDVGFEVSINPYRGCENGCIYCYARPTHEYLGFSAGLDFETKILVKEDAPALLRKELASPKWQPLVVSISGVTDPYQPIERRLGLTRRCLEVFADLRNPVGVVTKSHLVCRDSDLLAELAQYQAAAAFLSITTLDAELARRMEPRATQPTGRLAAIEELTHAGVPVGVLVAPVIPGLTDHELPAILEAAAKAGARCAGYVLLRLPHGLGPLFEQWLRQHYPERCDKVLSRLRDMRGGEIYDPRFGSRMRGEGVLAEQIASLFALGCRRAGIGSRFPSLSTAAFRRPGGTQRLLFE